MNLHPQEIVDAIEDFLDNYENRLITSLKPTDKFMKKDDRRLKFLLEVALHEYLSPNKCIFEYKLSNKEFTDMMKEIKLSFIKAIIEPGEMVGIIAAQSIGEPTSQMSITSYTRIKIVIKHLPSGSIKLYSNKIGILCDEIINNNPSLTINTGHVNSVETDLSTLENEYYIVGVDKHENTYWNKISHVSRHPVNGQLMEVTTKSGRMITTTLSHSHLVRNNQTVEPIMGSDLKVGMRIPVARYIDNSFVNNSINIDNNEYKLDYTFGTFIGEYIITFIDKVNKIPDFVFTAPNEFKAGLIQTYFDDNLVYDGKQIGVSSQNGQIIKDISLLLSYFGIFGSMKSVVNDSLNVVYHFTISSEYCLLYKQHIGTLAHHQILDQIVTSTSTDIADEIDKINGLGEIITKCSTSLNLLNVLNISNSDIDRKTLNMFISIFEAHKDAKTIEPELLILKQASESGVVWDEIIDINIYTPDQNDYVYDFTVPGNQTFMVDNGVIVHNTLNTKHFAGVASGNTAANRIQDSANMGVNRIQELVHFSKNIKTPQMMIYFKEPYSTNRSALNKIVSYFKHLSIRHLITSAEVYYDVGTNDILSKQLNTDNVTGPFYVNNQKADINSLPFVFRIKMNIEKMLDKETTLLDIKTKFISHWYKNYTNLKNLKKNEKEVIGRISRCAILSNNVTDKEYIIHIRFSMSSFNYNIITEFLRMIFDDITLKGIENIDDVDVSHELVIKYNEETGGIINDKEYMVYTSGINIEKLRQIKGIDFQRTKCNDIAVILRLYGIEATRQILLHELATTYQKGTVNINLNHLSLLVDQMCHLGEISSIDRHGLSKIDMDPIARASFEKTMDHFVNAAIFNEKDTMKSVSSRIAVGRVISGGTGIFDLLLDTKKLENSEYTEDETGGRITFTQLEEEPIFKDIMKYEMGKTDFYIP
jgi:DNA-directed RNA polymerase beta' subunit